MKEAISQEAMSDSSHSCVLEGNESNISGSGLKSAAMLGIVLSVGASGVVVSQAEASAAVSEPTTSAETEAFSSSSEASSAVSEDASLRVVAYHTVESGESLWQIAQQHRVGLRELKSANGLPAETSIRVGQILKVPASNEGAQSAARSQSDSAQLIASVIASDVEAGSIADTTEQVAKKPVQPVAQNDSASGESAVVSQATEGASAQPEVNAESAESLVSPTPSIGIEIADASAVDESTSLSVEGGPVVTALVTPASPASYRVQVGDTIHSIASSLGTTSEELARFNGLSNPNVIYAGATLRVPEAESAPSSQQQLARRDPSPSPTADVNRAEQSTISDKLAYLRSTVSRQSESDLLQSLRGSSPQEAVSVGGEQVTERDLFNAGEERSESVDPYVASLLEDVQEISNSSSQVAEIDSSANFEADRTLLSRADRPGGFRREERVALSGDEPSSEVGSDLLAAAPLNPAAYVPAQRSSAGQVVSPDMPLLPSSDEYLPEVPNHFDGYTWPAQGTLTSGYGWRWGRMHRGIDIAGPVGTPILAAAPGVVEQAGWNSGGYGNLVQIRHPDGSMTLYAHNNRLNVSAGQQVSQGQQIAEMGSTGYSTGPHLHFEVHQGGGAVNPVAYLP